MMVEVRIAILGDLLIRTRDGASRRIAGSMPRTLLAELVLSANTAVSYDRLVARLWGESAPSSAQAAVYNHVMRLRQLLASDGEDSRLVTVDKGYLLQVEHGEVDAHLFDDLCADGMRAISAGRHGKAAEDMAAALALWRGSPLADVPRLEGDARLQHLTELHLSALSTRIEADLALGRHGGLVSELRTLTSEYPLREGFWSQLLVALYRSGRQAEALEAYQQARKVLVVELGVEPGPELRELHSRILAGEDVRPTAAVRSDSASALAAASGPVVAVPRHLPAAAGHFTGRRIELEQLAALADSRDSTEAWRHTVVICAVDGMAGIGKTALAVHTGHRLAGRFPDGQLFVDLHGHTEGVAPREPGQALDWLLRALGVPAGQIPEESDARAALYRQRLAGTRTLIVLDNAASEAQVRPLLPGTPGCLVLVTSRRRLKGLDDAHTLSLDLLPPADAKALLRDVAGPGRIAAEDPLVEEIAHSCGRLPLALRIAGALLRHRPAWSLEHLARLLRDQHQRIRALSDGERDLATVFDLSYTALGDRHRLLLRRLALVPGPDADVYAAGALLAADPGTALALLEVLVDHNLLIAHALGRYRLHDLVRAHAHALAATDPQADRDAALDRLLGYYACTAQNASVPVARYPRPAPPGPALLHAPAVSDPETAWAWLRTERDNLEAAYTHAHTRGLHVHELALAAGLAELLLADGPFDRALAVFQAAAETGESRDHRTAYATALTDLGNARHLAGDPRAADTLARALDLHRTLGNVFGEAGTLAELGRVRSQFGNLAQAIDALAGALELYRVLGSRPGEATALTDLGRVRRLIGDLPGAGRAATRALEIYRVLGNRVGQAKALTELGVVRYMLGSQDEAVDALTDVLEICRADGHRNHEAIALMYLGSFWRQTGDVSLAADALTRALEINRAHAHRNNEAGTLVELGLVRQMTGDLPGAADAVRQGLELLRAGGLRSNEAWALNQYAAIIAATGDQARALTLYGQALAMNRELTKPDDEAASLEGLAECHLTAGETAAGITHLKQALDILQNMGMEAGADRVRTRLTALTAE